MNNHNPETNNLSIVVQPINPAVLNLAVLAPHAHRTDSWNVATPRVFGPVLFSRDLHGCSLSSLSTLVLCRLAVHAPALSRLNACTCHWHV